MTHIQTPIGVNLFVNSKETGSNESLMTHITIIGFPNTWIMEPAVTVSHLVP